MTSYPLLLKQLWHTPLAYAPDQEIAYRDQLRLSCRGVYVRIKQFWQPMVFGKVT